MTQEEFVETRCVGRPYDSCIDSPCKYSSHSGCRHPDCPNEKGDAPESKLDVIKAIALVDRQEGGRENIERKKIPFESIFTKDDLIQKHGQLEFPGLEL